MARAKRTAFTAFGWIVWQALAKVGVPLAKNKIKQGRGGRGTSR